MFTYSYLSLNLNKIFIDKTLTTLLVGNLKIHITANNLHFCYFLVLFIEDCRGLNIHVFYPYYIEMIKHMLGKGVCWALE